MPSTMQDIKSLHPLLIFFIFEPPYLALNHLFSLTTKKTPNFQITVNSLGRESTGNLVTSE